MKKHCVYGIRSSISNEIFYIGVTNNITKRKYRHIKEAKIYLELDRPKNKFNGLKNNKILKIWKNDGEIIFDILYESDSYEDAQNKEMELINLYGRIVLDTGTLTNMSKGGEGVLGVSGRDISREERVAHSLKIKGKPRRKKTKEEIRSMEVNFSKEFDSGQRKITTNDKNRKLAQIAITKKVSKEVYAINDMGEIVFKFINGAEASRVLSNSKKRQCNISTVALRQKWCKTYEYYWRYAIDYDSTEDFSDMIKLKEKYMESSKTNRPKKLILQINPDTKTIIKTWKSVLEISREFNQPLSKLYNRINKNIEFNGSLWKFSDPLNS